MLSARVLLMGGGCLEVSVAAADAAELAHQVGFGRVLACRHLAEDGEWRLAIIPVQRIQLITLEDDGSSVIGAEEAHSVRLRT